MSTTPSSRKHTCPKCNATFARKDNRDRHLQDQKIDCATKVCRATVDETSELLSTLLGVFRGPLRIEDGKQDDEDYLVSILADYWRSICIVSEARPPRTYELLHNVMDTLNGKQMELLYTRVLTRPNVVSDPMRQSLQALYRQVVRQHNKGISQIHRKSTLNIMRYMRGWPGLFNAT